MRKTILVLILIIFTNFQAFALESGPCSAPDSTCQAFELDSEARVLKDFSVIVISQANLGKVRRGEIIPINSTTDGVRGKVRPRIAVFGEPSTLYTISCIKEFSKIVFANSSAETTFDECYLVPQYGIGTGSTSLSGEWIDPVTPEEQYYIDFEITVPDSAIDGIIESGNIHIEIAYE